MSAPERIWADEDTWFTGPGRTKRATEYIRLDLHEAAVEALRGEARESAMQALASMGQAQEAYEAQLKAEAELAAAQQREAGLTDAVERLVVVLDRNDKKGPIPDVEMMFCWLAAQDIRAAFRAALSHNGRKGE